MLRDQFFLWALVLAAPLAAAESNFSYHDFLVSNSSPVAFQAAAEVIAQMPELSARQYAAAASEDKAAHTGDETHFLHDKLLVAFACYGEVETLLPPAQVEHVFVFKFTPNAHSVVVLKIPNPYFVPHKSLESFGGPNYSPYRNVERVVRAALLRKMMGSSMVTAPLKELALRQGVSPDDLLNDTTTIVVTSFIYFVPDNGGRAISDGLTDADIERIVAGIMLTGMYGLHRGSIMRGVDGLIYFIDLERTHADVLQNDIAKSVEHIVTGGIRDHSIARALLRYLFTYQNFADEQKLSLLIRFCVPKKVNFNDLAQRDDFLQAAPLVLKKFLQELLDARLITPAIVDALRQVDSSPWVVSACDALSR